MTPRRETLTGLGVIGYLVDGVAIFNTSDGFSYSNANAKDATPNGGFNGDGIWNRDALPNEGSSFDYALAHQPGSGQYHNHVNPIATRHLLGDNVTYAGTPANNSTKNYSENLATATFRHSPIIGWMRDGLPLYGPYGYDGGSTGATAVANLSAGSVGSATVTNGGTLYQSTPLVIFTGGGGSGAAATAVITGGIVTAITMTNGGTGYISAPTVTIGGVRRMISGYQLRDGTNGTTNITSTGRTTLPAWAAVAQGRSATLSAGQYGPTTTYTSTAPPLTYTLGHFVEDYDYLGDLGYTQGSKTNAGGVFFDLNQYNVRFCVTPEFPSGTWAYFTTIKADGTSIYPYLASAWYYGSATGGTRTEAQMNADTPLTLHFRGGANSALSVPSPPVTNGVVSLTWSAVEGGTYSVDASSDQSGWTSKQTGLVSTGISTGTSYNVLGSSGTEYARVNRTALAAYDATGQSAATFSQSTIQSYVIPAPNTPPTITGIGDRSILKDTSTGALAFTVGDAETAAASITVSGSSGNITLVPDANIVFGGSGANRNVTVTPAAGQTGTATITINANDGIATTGTSFVLSVQASNTPPTITGIASQSISQNTSTGALAFTVGDAETAVGGLTVSGSSGNITLVPEANIVFGGSGAGRTVTVTPANGQTGSATISVNVSDGIATTGTDFVLTVSGANTPPTFTGIASQSISQNTNTGALAFTVGDMETPLGSLTVSGSSGNITLVPNAGIVFGGSGASRTVTVTPAGGQTGTAMITVTVNDGAATMSTNFLLTVTSPVASNNILLIIADDFGIDASALYNTSPAASLAPTPEIAKIAANGVRFTNAYAYPTCSPTRSAMLTGRFGFRTGTGDVVSTAANNSLASAEFTLPKAFAANSGLGYQLKHFGKWHLTAGTGQTVNRSPCEIGGWPAFAGAISGGLASYTSWTKVISDGTAGGTSSGTVATYATTDTVNDAAAWIQAQARADKPWFAWVAFNAPHAPFHLPSPTTLCPTYASLSGTAGDITANPRSYYNAAIEAMDTEIGNLLKAADLNKTTVIFIGDNGTPNQVLQTPFPAMHGKDTLYQGGVWVPMIIRSPNVVSPGRTSDVFAHVVDLYSTILELAGISVTATVPADVTLDSQSLLPVLQNQAVTRPRDYAEQFDTSLPATGGRVLRDERYKIIRNRTGTDEFYDLQADPYETTNLLAGGIGAMTATQQSHYYRLRYQPRALHHGDRDEWHQPALRRRRLRDDCSAKCGHHSDLWRCTDLTAGFWAPVSGATSSLSGADLTFTDPAPPAGSAYYGVVTETQ